MISHQNEYHPSCLENLEKALSSYQIHPSQIGTTFNVFMNIQFDSNGKIKVSPPQSKAGDFTVFEAKMDLIVGLTACSGEGTNHGVCKPIEFEVLDFPNR